MKGGGMAGQGGAKVTPEELAKMAALARLRPDEEERERLVRDLNRVLEHVAALGEVTLGAPEEEDGQSTASGRVRAEGLGPDPLLRAPAELAPDWRDGFFVVPRLPGVEGEDGE